MIKKWVKILPYWLVMKFCRSMNASVGNFNKYSVRYYQIDEGEFVVFSEEVQEVFNKRSRERDEEKRNKKLEKINKQLDKDYSLKSELRKQVEQEIEQEKEEYEE